MSAETTKENSTAADTEIDDRDREPVGRAPVKVIPFHKTRDEAIEACRSYYRNRPLLPRKFLKEDHLQEIQGGYVPYFLLSGTADLAVTYEAQDSAPQEGPGKIVKEITDWQADRRASIAYYHLPVNTSGQIPESFMRRLEPYRLKERIAAEDAPDREEIQELLQTDIQRDADLEKKRIRETLSGILQKTVEHSYVKEQSADISCQNTEEECVLFPIYLLTTKLGKRYYHFGMNGQTGEVYGDIPVSYPRLLALFMALFAGCAFAVWGVMRLLFFLARMPVSTFTGNIFLMIGLFIGLLAANHVVSDRYAKMKPPKAKRNGEGQANLSYQILSTDYSDKKIRTQYVDKRNTVIREES